MKLAKSRKEKKKKKLIAMNQSQSILNNGFTDLSEACFPIARNLLKKVLWTAVQ